MKNKTLCLPWKYDYGETHAGKTTNGEIVLKIWRIDDSDHNKGWTSVDTIPRMGYAIMHGTFPMLINEVPDLKEPIYRDLIEAIKNAVYNVTFRSKVDGVGGGSKKSDKETKDRLHFKPATTPVYDRWWEQIRYY